MAGTANTNSGTIVRSLKIVLGLAFVTVGAVKLTGSLRTVQLFEHIGWGQWFRYFSGALDLIGGLMVFVTGWTFYGALLLVCTVGLATVLTFAGRIHDSAVPPVLLTSLAAVVAWLTRPHEAQPRRTTEVGTFR
jgi:putative oxidoreductase